MTFDEIFEQRSRPENADPLYGRTLGDIEEQARMEMSKLLYEEFAPPPYGKGREISRKNTRALHRDFWKRYEKMDLPLPFDLGPWGSEQRLQRTAEQLVKLKPEQVPETIIDWFPQRGVKAKENLTHAEFLKRRREKRRSKAKLERERKEKNAHAIRETMAKERGE